MMERKIIRPIEIIRNHGIMQFFDSLESFASSRLEDYWLKYKYKSRYGDIAPRPDERLWIDPENLKYSISSDDMYMNDRDYPRYGILDGPWDLHKIHWRESRVWSGLAERFEEGKAWEDTTYYQSSMEILESGGSPGYIDGLQTEENLEKYLKYLDELYESIRHDGYDPSSVITVHIGRGGEWMVGHGNHRRTIASIAGVESVPVRVRFRHRKWQDIRCRCHEARTPEEISGFEEYLSHPDVPDVTTG